MQVFAIIEIINVSVVLTCVFLLKIWPGDTLVFYGVMLAVVAFSVLAMYILYSIRHFKECGLAVTYDKCKLMTMVTFSGWDLYGNVCVTARTQGTSVILNIFFGPLLNAANAIATQVQAAVLLLSSNVTAAFRPQIIKSYAINDIDRMNKLMLFSSKASISLFSLLAVPVFIEMPFVLNIWLVTPPEYTLSITRIALLTCCIGAINSILVIPIHATGKIKALSFIGGTIYLLTLPTMYVLLTYLKSPELAYFVNFGFMFITISSSFIT